MTVPATALLTAKWAGGVLDEGYVPFPKRLLRAAPKLFGGPQGLEQLIVVLTLVDYLRPNVRFPSLGVLAFNAGMDPDRFFARLEELRAAHLVSVIGNRDSLRYDLDGLYRAVLEASSDA